MNAEVFEWVKNLVGKQGCIGEGLGTQAGLRSLEGLGSAIWAAPKSPFAS